jgi:hypothetical protein
MVRASTASRPRLAKLETTGFTTATKAEAVRIALSEGLESPGDIHDFIKAKFGHDIPKPTISSYKAQERARQAKRGNATPGCKPRRPLVEGDVAPSDRPRSAGEPDVLLALEGIKELVGQFGADRVKKMVDLLS